MRQRRLLGRSVPGADRRRVQQPTGRQDADAGVVDDAVADDGAVSHRQRRVEDAAPQQQSSRIVREAPKSKEREKSGTWNGACVCVLVSKSILLRAQSNRTKETKETSDRRRRRGRR